MRRITVGLVWAVLGGVFGAALGLGLVPGWVGFVAAGVYVVFVAGLVVTGRVGGRSTSRP